MVLGVFNVIYLLMTLGRKYINLCVRVCMYVCLCKCVHV